MVVEEQFEFVDAAGLASFEGVVHHGLEAFHEDCHQLLRIHPCRLVHVHLLRVDHFSDQRAVVALLALTPAQLLFQHLYLPRECLVLLQFLQVLLVHLLVFDEHLLVVIIDLLLGWLLVVLGLAAHQRDVIHEVLRDVGLPDALEERLHGGLDVLEVVAVDGQL